MYKEHKFYIHSHTPTLARFVGVYPLPLGKFFTCEMVNNLILHCIKNRKVPFHAQIDYPNNIHIKDIQQNPHPQKQDRLTQERIIRMNLAYCNRCI